MAAFTWSTILAIWTLLGTFLFQAGTPEIKKEEKEMDLNSFKMSNSYTLYCFYKEREYPAFPSACMTRQMFADLFPSSCTILENKNIFDLTPNFLLALTFPIWEGTKQAVKCL